MKKRKVYCAGPLFNPKEREEMASIAEVLEESGYSVFLPQRDGLEFAELFPRLVKEGIGPKDTIQLLNMAIFSLDVYEVMDSDGLVLNMNGRVPDEGAMVEAGIAWSHGKAIVIFQNDDRSLLEGSSNPLATGLSNFQVASEYNQIPASFAAKFEEISKSGPKPNISFNKATELGKQIKEYLAAHKSEQELVSLLIRLFEGSKCTETNTTNINAARIP
ncbi:MAG: nucleoside 2-deoxyribosyltransferase [Planctomycetes bacterium]|nr:nucleoside 2-deoxyribosyltransferase [Planctomycetota bacterium]